MRSVTAIALGSLFIVVMILLLQLAFIFIAFAYNSLAKDLIFLNEISSYFRYILGMPVFLLTIFSGGYITASIANMNASIKVWFHGIIVGLITVGGMMYSALDNSDLTLMGVVVFMLALSATIAGGLCWQRNNNTNELS